ncbi:peptidoglycan D,D-transpeptidase FtsI family protein [Granulicatella seriolae]|uniref:Penicillin-binding protein 2 n=1 Tax=Granulicatella seriolae TaxID=2967226 RepID=A0ABT1WPC3_9LACT|nr:penicillin-binding protein 2 [Granulicatella seriolae]
MKNSTKESMRNRRIASISLMGVAVLLFLIFSFKFSSIMLTGKYGNVDLKQQITDVTNVSKILPAKRGTIYDAGGSPIAIDATSYSLYAVLTNKWSQNEEKPDFVQDIPTTAAKLAPFLDLSVTEIEDILKQKGVDQVEFGNSGMNLTVEIKMKIDALKLPGIKFSESPSRFYSNGIFASHLVGYTDLETSNAEGTSLPQLVGKMGVEGLYNTELTGTAGEIRYQTDGKDIPVANSEVVTKQPVDGGNIHLTLDKRLESYLESLMSEVNDKFQPNSMTAMLVDPKTGNILAATQRPTFNATSKEGINTMWNNLLTDEAYEPGSTMKVLALAAAINEGVFDPNEMYQSGSIKIYDDLVSDYNKVGWGRISYLEGLAHSSNVAFVHIIEKIGVEKWKQYLHDFQFAMSTNSGFLNEVAGSNPYESYLQQLSTGFGQGITVTVYQMMQAFTAIANNGQMMKLRLVDSVENPVTGDVKKIDPVPLARPISAETAKKTLDYLYKATGFTGGTATNFVIEGEQIAAKTGTAELINPDTGSYYSSGNNYIYSVVGYAPATDPKYIFYVTIKQPQNNPDGLAGASILEEVFNPFMKRVLEYNRLSTNQ